MHRGRRRPAARWSEVPTFELDKHVKTFTKPDAKGREEAPNCQVTPEMEAILRIIARENLGLATRQAHPEEAIAAARRGRELGVKNMLITHGFTTVPGSAMAQAKEVTDMGARSRSVPPVPRRTERAAALPDALDADQRQARGAGGEGARRQSLVISSDLGQSANITHPDGSGRGRGGQEGGLDDADIEQMLRKNLARLLGRKGDARLTLHLRQPWSGGVEGPQSRAPGQVPWRWDLHNDRSEGEVRPRHGGGQNVFQSSLRTRSLLPQSFPRLPISGAPAYHARTTRGDVDLPHPGRSGAHRVPGKTINGTELTSNAILDGSTSTAPSCAAFIVATSSSNSRSNAASEMAIPGERVDGSHCAEARSIPQWVVSDACFVD